MDDKPELTGSFYFSKKSLLIHLRDFFLPLWPIFTITIAIFGVLWTFSEAIIQFTDSLPLGWRSLLILLVSSFLLALFWNLYRYLNRLPMGFEQVSKHSKRIAHLQKSKWEFLLAKSLLEEKIGPLDRELEDLIAGKQFVPASKPESFLSYYYWLGSRPRNMNNMLEVANKLLIDDFPKSLQSSEKKPANPLTILHAVETLARFYRDTIEYERSSRAILPSEKLSNLHSLQLGWTEPIRAAVRQLFDFLDDICMFNPKSGEQISFVIKFEEIPNIDEFLAEVKRLENSNASSEFWW